MRCSSQGTESRKGIKGRKKAVPPQARPAARTRPPRPPDDVGHLYLARNQAQPKKCIGHALLLHHGLRSQQAHGGAGPARNEAADHRRIQAAETCHQGHGLLPCALGQAIGARELVEQRAQHLRMALHQAARGQVERGVARQAFAIGQHARANRQLGGRVERVPDGPGVHALALEGGARISRGQVDGLDLVPGQARLVQRTHQQVMGAGAFLQRHAPALEVGQGAQRRVRRHEDGRAFGLGRLGAHVQQVTARGLGKDRG
ncbi:hypothetical protein GY14_23310 [Delftia tsuruhatensis]|nr:hypothetical protein GY14_23310 [Delftia tsuruhatensis]